MRSLVIYLVWAAAFIFVACTVMLAVGSAAPRDFPVGSTVSIEKGMTLSGVADYLSENGVVKSALLFKAYAILIGKKSASVKTGDYLFLRSESALAVAKRLVEGLEGFPIAKVTIPEGSDTGDIAAIISRSIPAFASTTFVSLAKPHEGYLFPETYFWPKNVKPEQVIAEMTAQFDKEIAGAKDGLASSSRSVPDLVKMAAILEREATSSDDKRIVAGILWKRIDAGMPLQVDAAPDTYDHPGLTPNPIADPGLAAILDAAHPTKTPYWYYLSDKHGVLHYATTLEGHAANKNRYLQ
jgi:UPF0755 protein